MYLEENPWEVIEYRLQKLQTERPRHLCHPHQPVGGVGVDQLAQVLQGTEHGIV